MLISNIKLISNIYSVPLQIFTVLTKGIVWETEKTIFQHLI